MRAKRNTYIGNPIYSYLRKYRFFEKGRGRKISYFYAYNPYPKWTGPAPPGPARPWRSLKAYISERKLGTVLKFSGIMVVLDKIVVLNLETDILKTPKMVAIFAESEISAFFCCFLCITFEIYGIFEFWKIHEKELKKCHQNDNWSFRKKENFYEKNPFVHENFEFFCIFCRILPRNFNI